LYTLLAQVSTQNQVSLWLSDSSIGNNFSVAVELQSSSLITAIRFF